LSRALPVDEFERWLRESKWGVVAASTPVD
jgi:hypothetical protein